MDILTRKLLELLQSDFPLSRRPFHDLALRLHANESEVLDLTAQLITRNLVRRIGPIFRAVRLGYTSTLVAAQVSHEKLTGFVAEVNSHPGVSHNYAREHPFNTWFTLTVNGTETIDEYLAYLSRKYDLPAIHSLPSLKLFKLNTQFMTADSDSDSASMGIRDDVSAVNQGYNVTLDEHPEPLTDAQIRLIRVLQNDLPVVAKPFDDMASTAGWSVADIFSQIEQWLVNGVIRRFGASLRHQNIGYLANGMAVFQVPDNQIDAAGAALSSFQQVSHCYHRPSFTGWPFNLFGMTHAASNAALRQTFENMIERIKPIRYDLLLTTKEYKKETVKYFYEGIQPEKT